MWINTEYLKEACKSRGLTLSGALKKAAVSRTAYYSLTRQYSILPETIHKIAEALDISVISLLQSGPEELLLARRREAQVRKVKKSYPEVLAENVWHTLILLEESPIDRIERALRRAR